MSAVRSNGTYTGVDPGFLVLIPTPPVMQPHDHGAAQIGKEVAARQFEQALRTVIREELRAALKEDE